MQLNLESPPKKRRSPRPRKSGIPRKWILGGCRKCRQPGLNHGRCLDAVCYSEEHAAGRVQQWPKAKSTDLTDQPPPDVIPANAGIQSSAEAAPISPLERAENADTSPERSLETVLEQVFELFEGAGITLSPKYSARLCTMIVDHWDRRRALTHDYPRPMGAAA